MTLQFVDKMVLIPISDWEKLKEQQKKCKDIDMGKKHSEKEKQIKKDDIIIDKSVVTRQQKDKVNLIPWITLTNDIE